MTLAQNVLLFTDLKPSAAYVLGFLDMTGALVYTRDCTSNENGRVMMLLEPLYFPMPGGYYFVQLVEVATTAIIGKAEFHWTGSQAVAQTAFEVLGFEVEPGMRVLQALRYHNAVLLGKSSVNGRVEVFKGMDGVTDRVSSTTTDDGARTSVVYHPTPDEEFGMGP